MRSDEFLRALDLLPLHLRDRAALLRGYINARDCLDCQQIGDALNLALTAAQYDELGSTRDLLDAAERLAARHDLTCRPEPIPRRGRGQIARWAKTSAPLVAATDASWKGRVGGIGYVVSDGHYGLRGRGTGPLDPTGVSRVLINELRAVDLLLSAYERVPPGMTVLLDSRIALRYLHRWQAGETEAMPAGYSLRPRAANAQPTLVRLAGLVAHRPDISFAHVRGHSGHALNEAADGLSHMARRRMTEPFDLRPRAYSLVDAFLHSWHAALAH